MPSLAHRRSRSAVIDPVYAVARAAPRRPAPGRQTWYYGRGELEAHRFSLVRVRGHRDCQKVFHPGLFARAQHLSWFRITIDRAALPARLDLAMVGGFSLMLNGQMLHRRAEDAADAVRIALGRHRVAGANRIQVAVFGMAEPGCLSCPALSGWEWSADGFTRLD